MSEHYEYIIDPAFKGKDGEKFFTPGGASFRVFSSLRAFIDGGNRFDGNVFIAPGIYSEPLKEEGT